MMDTHAQAQNLAKRPYFIGVSADTTEGGKQIFFARVLEMEGCFGQGESAEAAISDLRLAMVDFIESLLEDGLPVPEPTRVIDPTVGTATRGTFTFTAEAKPGRELQPKQEASYPDAFLLSVSA